MASLSTSKAGTRKIQFTDGDGIRKTIYLGDASLKDARTVKTYIEAILSAKGHGVTVAPEVAAWIDSLPDILAGKLAAVGLVNARGPRAGGDRLGAFLKAYATGKDWKPNTVANIGRAMALLKEYFGEFRALRSITEPEAAAWREWLRTDKKMKTNTMRRHVGRAKQFFAYAAKRKMIPDNPFGELASTLVADRTRDRFITRGEADAVMEACPNAEWRLLFALSRYGGLRCPSEHFALRWQDVDWEKGRITVNSPKTEHHAGKASRVIPIFAELRQPLEEAYDAAPEGAVFVLSRIGAVSPGTHLKRIIRRAGLTPWPKLFHNLRASRETELTETYPIQTVVAWLGNSPAVALKHYLQVPTEHFDRASEAPENRDAKDDAEGSEIEAQRGALRNEKPQKPPENRGISHFRVPPAGVRHSRSFRGKTSNRPESDADSDAFSDDDPDLAALVKAWERLTADERRLVLLAAGLAPVER